MVLIRSTIESLSSYILARKYYANNLEPREAHGHDVISTRMLQVCFSLICKPLETVFKLCLKKGNFHQSEKSKIVTVYKNL